MKATDLSIDEIAHLKMCNEHPEFQYAGINRTTLNTLNSYKLVEYAGNLKYEITKQGKELLSELMETPEENAETVSGHLGGELVEAATYASV